MLCLLCQQIYNRDSELFFKALTICIIKFLSAPFNNMTNPLFCDNNLFCHDILSDTPVNTTVYLPH